jgi:uncharacterized membrane protein YeaQ/YmgE (transglycosylase-associated protein family)
LAILSWIVIGLIAGWVAQRVVGGRSYVLNDLAIGLVGAIIGGLLFTNLSPAGTQPGFFESLFSAAVGAVIFLLGWRLFSRR